MTVVDEEERKRQQQRKKLKKCPFCNFINIHEDTITHHIKFTDDPAHKGIDVDKLDKSSYIIVERKPKPSPYGPYIRTEDLPLPWINCLWCDYKRKIAFDLSLHFLQEHREELLAIPVYSRDRKITKDLLDEPARFDSKFEWAMEFRVDVAVEMAKEENRDKGVKHAIRQIQKQILKLQEESSKKSARPEIRRSL